MHWYEELDDSIDEDSRARRADPLAFGAEVVEPTRDSEEEGFLEIWRSKATHHRWYADDAMYCFDKVLADPPADLVERLRAGTGCSRDKMRVIYDETAPK